MRIVRLIRSPLGAAIVALALATAAPATAGAAAVTAKPADSFVESIGVNVHIGDPGTPYETNQPLVEQRLEELGLRHIRGELYPKSPTEYQAIHELAAHGIKSTMILGELGEPETALGEMLNELKTPTLNGAVDAVEGYNEPSVSTEAAKAAVIEHQRRIWEGIKNDSALKALTVVGPSIIRNEQSKLGDVTAYINDGNIHSYPEGLPPEEKVGEYVKKAKEFNSFSDPIFATETGYTNATKWNPPNKGENRPVPEEVSAIYTPRLFFEYWTRGIARTFDYELLDDHADPNLESREDHFGLLRNDLSKKPAYTALQNTIALLSDPGVAFTPGRLEYTVAGGSSTLHSALLEKRDGSFYLALWRLESVWEPVAKQPIAAPKEAATVAVPAGLSSYAVYEPTASTTPIATGGATKSVPVEVGPGVTLVKLVPAAGTSEPPPTEPPPTEPPPSEPPPAEPPTTTTPVTQIAAPVVIEMPLVPPIVLSAPAEPHCLVPKLGGKTLAAARRTIRSVGCAIGTVTRRAGEAAGPRVVAQRPPAGRSLAAEAKIAVTLGALAAR